RHATNSPTFASCRTDVEEAAIGATRVAPFVGRPLAAALRGPPRARPEGQVERAPRDLDLGRDLVAVRSAGAALVGARRNVLELELAVLVRRRPPGAREDDPRVRDRLAVAVEHAPADPVQLEHERPRLLVEDAHRLRTHLRAALEVGAALAR